MTSLPVLRYHRPYCSICPFLSLSHRCSHSTSLTQHTRVLKDVRVPAAPPLPAAAPVIYSSHLLIVNTNSVNSISTNATAHKRRLLMNCGNEGDCRPGDKSLCCDVIVLHLQHRPFVQELFVSFFFLFRSLLEANVVLQGMCSWLALSQGGQVNVRL